MRRISVEAASVSDAGMLFAELRDIYEEAFPPEERMDAQAQVAKLQSGRSRLWIGRGPQGLIGFALVTSLTDGAWLLEHLATASASRGRGAGAQLLTNVRSDLGGQGATRLYLEVEAPELDASDPWRPRRLAWYQRQGALLVLDHKSYAMPNLLGTGAELRLNLLIIPLANAERPNRNTLCRDVQALYAEVYALQPDSPFARRARKALGC